MRKILITNDDGINADGLFRLVKAAKKFGKVYIIAPETQRSAMSHSITLRAHLDVKRVEFPVESVEAYACSGTPADCVRIGCLNIVPDGPDIVLSGINFGYNCATDLQYSATVGAAFEARFQGYQAVALSEGVGGCHEATDAYLEQIIEEVIEKPLDELKIWNVNFPDCKLEDCKGVKRNVLVSNDSIFTDRYVMEELEDGTMRFAVNGIYEPSGEEGTDLNAIFDNYVALGVVKNISN